MPCAQSSPWRAAIHAHAVPFDVQPGKIAELDAFVQGEHLQQIGTAAGNRGFYLLAEPGGNRAADLVLGIGGGCRREPADRSGAGRRIRQAAEQLAAASAV